MKTITIANTITILRGIIVDKEETGVDAFFSDAELLTAINVAKHALFGDRPGAFGLSLSGTDLTYVSEPTDYTSSDSISIESWAFEPLTYYAAAFTLIQKSKDSFYREASEKLMELYRGAL